MNEQEVQRIAEEAACKAVKRTFRLLGVDTDDVNSVNKLRSDLISARQVREFRETATKRFWLVVITGGVAAGLATFWEGIKAKLGMG